MLRPFTVLSGILLGLLVTGAGLFTASYSHAETLATDPAYYLVVQHDPSRASVSQTAITSQGQNFMSVMQTGGTSDVGCTRYASSADAEAAAADRYAGQQIQVVLAVDALHALAQTANISDDLLAMLPQLADADICTP